MRMVFPSHVIALLFTVVACSESYIEERSAYTVEANTYGLNVPVLMHEGSNRLVLSDFYADITAIDSMHLPDGLSTAWKKGETEVVLEGKMASWMGLLGVWSRGVLTTIPLRYPAIEAVTLVFDPQGKSVSSVDFVGDLNGWTAGKNTYQWNGEVWTLTMQLNPGGYPYCLVIDGEQQVDPGNPNQVPNGFGAFNSFLKVEASSADKTPHIFLSSTDDSSVTINSSLDQPSWLCLWQNQVVPVAVGTTQIAIPAAAKSMERSFLRVWAQTAQGVSNELRIPLAKGKVVSSTAELNRNDKERNIMYFMMVDRFVNGDSSIDEPVQDERILPRANYYGGDLAGIQQKLEEGYFASLGINTLWISPITENPRGAYQEYPEPRRWFSGYHGYWPVSFKKVDHRFGTNVGLKNLVDATHAEDYNIILDYVCNHVHQEHPIIIAHPEWKTDLVLPDGRRNLRLWDEQRLTTWFDDFLPTLDFSIPEVSEVMSDSALWWIESFGFDGFRHDATKHIPESFWRIATTKLKDLGQQTGRNYFQVGETFGSRELIQSYIGSGMMDGQFDFNLYFDAVSVFKDTKAPMSKLAESLEASLNLHGSLHLMCNITGNHDLTRFISLAGKAVRDDEDQKEAGWQREIKVEDPVGYQKLKMLETFIMTIPGIPVVFYGDEIGMPGANDPDNRRMMRFDDLSAAEADVKVHVSSITRIRADHMALLFGDMKVLVANDDLLVYARRYLGDEVLALFNNSDQPKTVTVPFVSPTYASLNKEGVTRSKEGELTVTLAPFSSQIVYANY